MDRNGFANRNGLLGLGQPLLTFWPELAEMLARRPNMRVVGSQSLGSSRLKLDLELAEKNWNVLIVQCTFTP